MASQQIVVLSFQDVLGNPLSNGSVTFRLNTDASAAVSGGPQISAGRLVTAILDVNGSCSVLLWPNDQLYPSGTVYFVRAYTATGVPAWSGEISVSSTVNYLLQDDGTSVFLLDGSPVDAILLD